MHFRIANTFTGSLARLTGEEQEVVETTGKMWRVIASLSMYTKILLYICINR